MIYDHYFKKLIFLKMLAIHYTPRFMIWEKTISLQNCWLLNMIYILYKFNSKEKIIKSMIFKVISTLITFLFDYLSIYLYISYLTNHLSIYLYAALENVHISVTKTAGSLLFRPFQKFHCIIYYARDCTICVC